MSQRAKLVIDADFAKLLTRLARGGVVSPVGLNLPQSLSFAEWRTAVAQLGMVAKASMWWWGDALSFGERKWGEKYEEAQGKSDYSYQTLRHAKWVSAQVELCRRRHKLSWGHHAEVAALEAGQQDAMLDGAERGGWSVRELRRTVRQTVRQARADAVRAGGVSQNGCGQNIGPYKCCTCVCGDAEKLLLDLPPRSVSAIITDAPYGVDAEEWDGKVPYHLLPRFLELTAGPVIWFGAAPVVAEAYASFDPKPERLLMWTPSFTLSHTTANGLYFRYHPIYAWRLPKEHDGPKWDVLTTPTESGNWWEHSCTKPLALMSDLCGIAPPGGIVLDPFAGSGTTLLAARNRGQHFLGFEINPEYCAITARRLAACETLAAAAQPAVPEAARIMAAD